MHQHKLIDRLHVLRYLFLHVTQREDVVLVVRVVQSERARKVVVHVPNVHLRRRERALLVVELVEVEPLFLQRVDLVVHGKEVERLSQSTVDLLLGVQQLCSRCTLLRRCSRRRVRSGHPRH